MSRDTTVDLTFHDKISGVHCGVLQTSEGMYDISGETIAQIIEDAKSLALHLGVEIDVFNLEYPEA